MCGSVPVGSDDLPHGVSALVSHEKAVLGVALSFDGALLMSTSADGAGVLWDTHRYTLLLYILFYYIFCFLYILFSPMARESCVTSIGTPTTPKIHLLTDVCIYLFINLFILYTYQNSQTQVLIFLSV